MFLIQGAVQALNSLQSNADYLKNRSYNNIPESELYAATILEVKKYFLR